MKKEPEPPPPKKKKVFQCLLNWIELSLLSFSADHCKSWDLENTPPFSLSSVYPLNHTQSFDQKHPKFVSFLTPPLRLRWSHKHWVSEEKSGTQKESCAEESPEKGMSQTPLSFMFFGGRFDK